jgi:cellulose synthase/poly-beta-1,6-N-acetylglucosamine synthase-like glycosyltransferase
MTLLAVLLGGAAAMLFLPAAILVAEVLAATTYRGRPGVIDGARPSLAVVIPAHDEAAIIGDTLRSIIPQLLKSDRLIVVADNCSDRTAAVAAAEGAEAISRTDPDHRGKGYALDYAMRHLACNPPAVVVVIDADCHVSAGAIDRLTRLCMQSKRPIQALYLMTASKEAGAMPGIREFAWVLKNHIRPLGLRRWGLPCQLMGTGMAFPWARISRAMLATGHIVEDLNLGIELARAGAPPLFCPEAVITSKFPASWEGMQTQRVRWEHGYLSVMLSDAPRLLVNAVVRRNRDLLALALDLTVPPLALLTLQVAALWCICAVFFVREGSAIPLAIATSTATLLAFSVLLAWTHYGRRIVSLTSLPLGIVYALRKIPVYMRFLLARQKSWVRSKRDDDQS